MLFVSVPDVTIPCVLQVTFMSDVDPRKRCFHCILTDSPPTTESPGPVTEELLLMLLSESGDSKKPAAKLARVEANALESSETDSKGGSSSDKADQDLADEDEEEGTVDEGTYSAEDDDGDSVCDEPESAVPTT